MNVAAQIRQANAAALPGFLEHPFFVQAARGVLRPQARDAYFHYEHRFVEQAVTVFGHLLVKAPDFGAQTHLVAILGGLVTDQTALFARILQQIGPPPPKPWPVAVAEFCDGMTAIAAQGAYHEGLAAMLAAEWTYAQVSRKLVAAGLADPLLHDWFALHVEDGFLDGVRWLEAELDRCVRDPDAMAQACDAFGRAVQIEIAFHSAAISPYSGVPPAGDAGG
ncbi:MAG: TenA family protein [Roseinatronobacter sp.]